MIVSGDQISREHKSIYINNLNQLSIANLWGGAVCCTIFSPRWVKALDMLLDKLRVAGLDFTTVGLLSFCAFNCVDVVCFFASDCKPRSKE